MSPRIVTLKIDGRDIGARSDESVLEVARENGIDIPTLCYLEGLSNVGACRLCLVEVGAASKLVPACVTRAEEGMEVRTNTERLKNYRRMILELIFSERNHVCAVCVSNGFCELQDLAARLGMDQVHVPYRFPRFEVDASHPRFVNDPNRCIMCSRCVRVCDEIEGAHTWDVAGRGVEAHVVTDLGGKWGDSDTCTSCGKCVQVCPTGALTEKGHAVAEMRKQSQFLPYLKAMREVNT
jgi:bidirectional [NiFe] hydrogenase diaphorase subunit